MPLHRLSRQNLPVLCGGERANCVMSFDCDFLQHRFKTWLWIFFIRLFRDAKRTLTDPTCFLHHSVVHGEGKEGGLLPIMAYKWKSPLCKFVAYSPRTLFSDGLQMFGWAMQKVFTITLEIF